MLIRKKVEGEVQYNDGEFAEVLTSGVEGSDDEGIQLETIQFHRDDTDDTREEFQQRFRVGMWLDISTTVEVVESSADA